MFISFELYLLSRAAMLSAIVKAPGAVVSLHLSWMLWVMSVRPKD